jgi:ribosomal protein L11 methylase PrmA
MKRYLMILIASTTALVSACNNPTFADEGKTAKDPTRKPDVVYVPTPEPVVKKMLTMAKVGPNDVVYDLGCGDGRIPIMAVRDFGAKSAVCVDIDPQRIKEIRANVEKAGLTDKIDVRHADMFTVDTSPATVVTLYLLPELNVRLRPKLQKELRNGARIVSQSFDMGEWKPAQKAEVSDKTVYLWNIQKERTARTQ